MPVIDVAASPDNAWNVGADPVFPVNIVPVVPAAVIPSALPAFP